MTEQDNGALNQVGTLLPTRPPLPPFTYDTARQKVRLAEDAWNSRDPETVAFAYAPDSRWRNRSEFVNGRQEIFAFLTREWEEVPHQADARGVIRGSYRFFSVFCSK